MIIDIKRTTNKVIFVGAITNVMLALIKIIIGWAGSSHALLADGVHSASDLITDVIVFFAALYGRKKADAAHPYGHRRIETIATIAIAGSLLAVAFGLIYDASLALQQQEGIQQPYLVLMVCLISIVANEWLFQYTKQYALQLKQDLLMANAWHHRSDAASSIVVLIGVLGSILGFNYFDACAALIVGLMIIHMGLKIGWQGVKELIDTSVEQTVLNDIQQKILQVSGVVGLHQLRGRNMASDIILDVHIMVGNDITVSEGHYIGHDVRNKIMQQFSQVKDIIVHIDPEDDAVGFDINSFRDRASIMQDLIDLSLPAQPLVQKIDIHYLGKNTSLDIYFVINDSKHNIDIINQYQHSIILHLPYISKVNVLYIG